MKELDFKMIADYVLIRPMRMMPPSRNPRAAFTLTELCVVIACIAILAVLVLPALAASKVQSASAGCLYNLRQLMAGCGMYQTEYNDYLMPNSPLLAGNNTNTWVGGAENWSSADANTNPVYYTSTLMWRYVNNDLNVYRCPGDVVQSANGTRIRSYSMNGQVGSTVSQVYNVGDLIYLKGSDIVRPTPANLFVFADESPASLNDGYLQVSENTPQFVDIPACYLEDGCGFSFADGHGEIHRWQTSALLIPVRYGYNTFNVLVGSHNADWIWFTQHASSHQ